MLDAKHESPGDGEAGNRPDPASLPSVEIRREALEELDGIEFLEREELLADLENEMHDCMASGHRRAADAMHRAIRALSPSKEEGRL